MSEQNVALSLLFVSHLSLTRPSQPDVGAGVGGGGGVGAGADEGAGAGAGGGARGRFAGVTVVVGRRVRGAEAAGGCVGGCNVRKWCLAALVQADAEATPACAAMCW